MPGTSVVSKIGVRIPSGEEEQVREWWTHINEAETLKRGLFVAFWAAVWYMKGKKRGKNLCHCIDQPLQGSYICHRASLMPSSCEGPRRITSNLHHWHICKALNQRKSRCKLLSKLGTLLLVLIGIDYAITHNCEWTHYNWLNQIEGDQDSQIDRTE